MRHLSLGQQSILLLPALLLLLLLYLNFYSHPARNRPAESRREIVVEVAGQVNGPGIYLFRDPPTVGETIRKAGGLKDPAPLGKEASEILHTGTLLLVAKESSKIPQSSSAPREREEGEGLFPERRLPGRASGAQDLIRIKIVRMEARKLLVFSIPLDLNRVAAEDLCFIPGIGTALAQEIVAYRTRRRGFRSVEELKNVKGIGEKKWKDLKPFFVVNAAPLPK